MKLSIIDRVIIVKSLLPATGTIEQVKLIASIRQKLDFTEQQYQEFKIFEPYKGVLEIPNVTSNMVERILEYNLSIQEFEFLKLAAQNCNNNGWVTESSLNTVEYLLNYTLE